MEAELIPHIICPGCRAELAATALICHHCGRSTTGGPQPPQPRSAASRAQPGAVIAGRGQARELMNRPWVIIVLMLHVGFLGIPIYWKTTYSTGVRLAMIVASIVYTIAAVAAIFWMLRWLAGMIWG